MSTNNQEADKFNLSDEQKQNLKKYGVFALMGIAFVAFLWLIFAPSASNRTEQQSGFNMEIPDPRSEELIGDRRDAYEQERVRQRQAERMRSLHDFGALLNETDTQQPSGELSLLTEETPPARVGGTRTTPRHATTDTRSLQHSMDAHHDVTRTLGSFYQMPRHDPERERLQRELDEMQRRLDDRESEQNALDMQIEIMERSLQMVAQHFPPGMTVENIAANNEIEQQQATANRNIPGRANVVPVAQVQQQVVSALPRQMSTEDFIEAFAQPRNMRFHTATSPAISQPRNTISAVICTDQNVANGENVRLRLTEPMLADGMKIPRNSLLSGVARIQGERLQITISSIEHNGSILPVEIAVFDTDGQRGIFIPNAHEINAAKEIIANMGTSAGTSINFSTNASEQFIADMGRNAVQGVSQMFSRRMREVRVSLKAGHRVLLLPNDR